MTIRLLLNPALPDAESAARSAIAIDSAITTLREANDAFSKLRFTAIIAKSVFNDFRVALSDLLTPANRYKLAGHPYGNHVRGKKRWLLEQKHRMKAQ